MRFLVDAQLPPALARWLVANGHGAEHVADHGWSSVSDRIVWDRAVAIDAVIITKDGDFAIRRALVEGPRIGWIRMGNTRRRELLLRMERLLPLILAAIERGDTLVEIG